MKKITMFLGISLVSVFLVACDDIVIDDIDVNDNEITEPVFNEDVDNDKDDKVFESNSIMIKSFADKDLGLETEQYNYKLEINNLKIYSIVDIDKNSEQYQEMVNEGYVDGEDFNYIVANYTVTNTSQKPFLFEYPVILININPEGKSAEEHLVVSDNRMFIDIPVGGVIQPNESYSTSVFIKFKSNPENINTLEFITDYTYGENQNIIGYPSKLNTVIKGEAF